MKNKRFAILAVVTLFLLAGSQVAFADLLFTGSSGSLAASANFNITGNTLTITLTNTSPADVLIPSDVLTGLFFNTGGVSLVTPASASLNGSTAYYGSTTNGPGEGWVYLSNLNQYGDNAGISASGLGGVFGNHPCFLASQPQCVSPLDGLNYGILSAGDNTATGNTGVTGHGPLFKDSLQFTVTASGLTYADLGNTVTFQYGTALSEPHFDSPDGGMTLMLLGGALVALETLRRRLSI